MKLIITKLAYWPVWIAIENQKLSKGTVPTSIPLDLHPPCNLPVATTQSTMKIFMLPLHLLNSIYLHVKLFVISNDD